MDRAVIRKIGQADVKKRICVRDHERRAFNRGNEDRRVDALAAVIDAGILIGITDGKLRVARAEAGPKLCQDPGAVALAETVSYIAGKRREQAHPKIVLSGAVFRPIRADKGKPVFTEDLAVDLTAIFFDGVEPDQLQIQIVVGKRLIERLRIIAHVKYAAHSFEWRAKRTADIFAVPASAHFIKIFVKIQLHFDSPCNDDRCFAEKHASRPS